MSLYKTTVNTNNDTNPYPSVSLAMPLSLWPYWPSQHPHPYYELPPSLSPSTNPASPSSTLSFLLRRPIASFLPFLFPGLPANIGCL